MALASVVDPKSVYLDPELDICANLDLARDFSLLNFEKVFLSKYFLYNLFYKKIIFSIYENNRT